MTREEQIIEAGAYYSCGLRPPKTCGHNMHELVYINSNLAFEAGAKWADEHPDSNRTYTKQQLIDMGFAFTTNGDIVTPGQSNEDLKKYLQYKKRKFIEKACDWLMTTSNFYQGGSNALPEVICMFNTIDEMVDSFRKEMADNFHKVIEG